jgi:hypothetical protein
VSATFTLPFGRHRGKRLDEVPAHYLTWLLDLPDLYPATRAAIEAFVQAPDAPDTTERPTPSEPPQRRPASQRQATPEPSARCAVCGLGGSAARPLVHASCASDEVAF